MASSSSIRPARRWARSSESIKRVAEIVADIASASMEQSTGIDQVNKALTQMDEVTQQNSALVEENAATAKALEQQAQSMDDQVGYFHISADDAAAAHSAPVEPLRQGHAAPKQNTQRRARAA